MTDDIEIRASVQGDLPLIEMLYGDAFPDENLLPLVRNLMQDAPIALSLVGTTGSSLVGHVVFTTCGVAGCECKVALLGPLGVASARQGQGLGSAMVRSGLQRLKSDGFSHVYVLGDPTYYERFGFMSEARVTPPYPLPAQWCGAWQSMSLRKAQCRGRLRVPRQWLQPALWAP